ncbi:MAG: cadherin-like domain-containing protein [Planctomycetes bacterium]|nr:cadherin-like domain-containing protein [Planctomycetota bacterium]
MKRKRRRLVFERLEDRRLLTGNISQVGYFDTWDGGIIRSTDVAGIAYHSPSGHLYLADSEINELSIFNGDNIFETSLSGDQVFREIASNNTEPTGITYNEFDGYFYVTNDTGSKTVTRYDSNLNNPLLVISTKDDVSSATDPEGITSDPSTGFLYVSDGNGGGLQVLVYNSDLDFQFVFSVDNQGDAEGIAFHQPSNHLFLIDGSQDVIFEYTLTGTLLEQYDISGFSPAPKSPQGLTFGPTSNPNDSPSALSLYIADGMKDNFADGRVFEAAIGSVPTNFPPTTSGIADVNVNTDAPDTVIDLFAAFDDFEDPDPALTYTIENNTNPSLFTSTTIDGVLGTLTLDYAPATDGTAIITVRATDTGTPPLFVETTFTVDVTPVNPNNPITIEVQVSTSSDDAEERPFGTVKLTSSDLEMTLDKTNQQIVGMRFTSLNIPPGASVQNAYLQFQADETGSDPTSLTIYGQAIDNATTFTSTSGNISSRSTTTASVAWSPVPWNTKDEAGPDQQTPNIAAVIQEIVNRPGWAIGNSLAIIVTGTGKRTAESFDGVPSAAPRLHVEYVTATNYTPTAVNDTATTSQDSAVTTDVLINDALGDPPTTITAVTQGTNGTVTFDAAAGTTTYTPNASFIGTDSHTYTITDADGEMSSATVDVTVTDPAAQAPIDFRVLQHGMDSPEDFPDLEADLANVASSDEFFVHVGDIKLGSDPCIESVYTNASSSLQTSSIPVFIVPGDNEWNDCSDPNQAWIYWDTHLMRLDENWSHSFNVLHQSVREENFAFVHSGVLFIGINLVGGSVHDSSEWVQRMTDDADWVNQNFNNFGSQVTSAVVFGHAFPDPTGGDRQQFGQDFVTSAQNFVKPILYIHGDIHNWQLDNPYNDAPNVTRVILEKGVPSVRVTVTHDPANPFAFDQSPLVVQSTVSPPPGAEPIDESQLATIVDEAILRLSHSNPDAASILAGLNFEVVDLPSNLLGRALPNAIQIDVNAAGFGWFVDTTPNDNVEFMVDTATNQAAVGSPASERVDLLTAVMHELGHVLGYEHTDSYSLMNAELPLGTRRLATELSGSKVDAFYELFGADR